MFQVSHIVHTFGCIRANNILTSLQNFLDPAAAIAKKSAVAHFPRPSDPAKSANKKDGTLFFLSFNENELRLIEVYFFLCQRFEMCNLSEAIQISLYFKKTHASFTRKSEKI